jgi:hypothetical protein
VGRKKSSMSPKNATYGYDFEPGSPVVWTGDGFLSYDYGIITEKIINAQRYYYKIYWIKRDETLGLYGSFETNALVQNYEHFIRHMI